MATVGHGFPVSCLILQLHFEVRTTFLGAADRRRGRIRTALTIAQLAKCNCRIKRAMREYFSSTALLDSTQLGLRTKFMVDEIAKLLAEDGKDIEIARRAAIVAVSEMGTQKKFKLGKKNETDYLVFIGRGELSRVAAIIGTHLDTLVV